MCGRVLMIALIAGAWPHVAQAQTPAVDLRGGYAFVADSDFDFPFGVYADIGVPVSPGMAIVGEVESRPHDSLPNARDVEHKQAPKCTWMTAKTLLQQPAQRG
jgi:hypothetical protein